MSDEIAAQFLAALRTLLATSERTDAELAAALGVSRPYLSRLRRRDRGVPGSVTLGFALRAAGVFPELGVFLTPILPTMSTPDTEGTETTESES